MTARHGSPLLEAISAPWGPRPTASPAAGRPLPPPCGALPHYNSRRAPRRGGRCACAVPRPGSRETRPGHVGAILWPGAGAARGGAGTAGRGAAAEGAEGCTSVCCRTKQGCFCSSSCSAASPQPVGGAVRSHPSAGKSPGGSASRGAKSPSFRVRLLRAQRSPYAITRGVSVTFPSEIL